MSPSERANEFIYTHEEQLQRISVCNCENSTLECAYSQTGNRMGSA